MVFDPTEFYDELPEWHVGALPEWRVPYDTHGTAEADFFEILDFGQPYLPTPNLVHQSDAIGFTVS